MVFVVLAYAVFVHMHSWVETRDSFRLNMIKQKDVEPF